MKDVARILLFVGFIWVLSDGLLGPLYGLFSEEIGGDFLSTAGAYAGYMFISGFLHLIFGRFANKPKYAKPVMLGGYLLAAAGCVAYIFISTPLGLFIVELVLGVANAMSSSTWDGLYGRNIKQHDGVKMWSYWEAGQAFIVGIGNVLGGVIATLFGFTVLFIIMAACQAVGAATIFFVQEVQQKEWN